MELEHQEIKLCLKCKKRPRQNLNERTLLCDNCYKTQQIPIKRTLKATSLSFAKEYTLKPSPETNNRLLKE